MAKTVNPVLFLSSGYIRRLPLRFERDLHASVLISHIGGFRIPDGSFLFYRSPRSDLDDAQELGFGQHVARLWQ